MARRMPGGIESQPTGRRSSIVPDPREFRLRSFLVLAFATVLLAALLRHVLHVYGGLSREDIRVDALLAALAIGVMAALFRRAYRS
jgi:hypothetical protein